MMKVLWRGKLGNLTVTNFKLGIGIPLSWTHVPVAFFESFIQIEKPNFTYLPAHNGPVDGLRNYIIEQAIVTGCSHVLLMDADQIYPVDTITRLLSHRLPVVHGMVFRRYPNFDNLLFKGEINHYTNMMEGVDYTDGDLVEVDAIGTGCALYDVRVFLDIEQPWFEFIPNPDTEKGGVVGEDIWFAQKLHKAGYKIYCDTGVKIGHLTMFTIDENFSRLYQSLLKRQMEINKRNDSS